ncbi:N-acetylglucosamine kinase [Tepiditoga spiralis]|uniref:N-acetylglucosamine kinase n=1 Tax=Tepiditoga spiralis TaxID=2108365 RepID=A0A7G1G9M3_9BACT|nr:BadF/BadG/BcrA/BcrD ATPase family protein [Tepiditoga spiralis]BBE31673.1 N-acetylglucosamine kinase [Tepiditoga spiralis]
MKILGIDGGGSNLRYCINNKKAVLKFGVNLTAETSEFLTKKFSELKKITGKVDKIVASLSGVENEKIKEKTYNILKNVFEINNIILKNDIEALVEVTNEKKFAVIICGTGINVMGIDKINNKRYQNGGWGYLFGDIGSGFWLSLRSIQEYLKYKDNLRNYDEIFESLEKYFKLSKTSDILNLLSEDNFKTKIASFTPVLLNEKSKLIDDLVNEGTNILANRCKIVLKRINSNILYLHGGTFKSKYFYDTFVDKFEEDIIFKFTTKNLECLLAGGML